MKTCFPAALSLLAPLMLAARSAQEGPPGYDDTPLLPASEWRVHDKNRPHPPIVTPGEGTAPPSDAIVLFDGRSLDAWQSGDGGPARWVLVDGAMEVNGSGTIETKRQFGDLQLHVEWRTPPAIESSSQGRGNSGVFLMGRYEVQILDSHENLTYADGQAAALYGQRPPDVNASRPAGAWQSFDLVFRALRFEGGELLEPARVTLFHNGVLVHHDQPFIGATAHRAVATYAPHDAKGPIKLQDHGNPMRFRNVWVREI